MERLLFTILFYFYFYFQSFGLIHKDVFAKLIESQVDTIYEFIIDSFPVIRKMSEATRVFVYLLFY